MTLNGTAEFHGQKLLTTTKKTDIWISIQGVPIKLDFIRPMSIGPDAFITGSLTLQSDHFATVSMVAGMSMDAAGKIQRVSDMSWNQGRTGFHYNFKAKAQANFFLLLEPIIEVYNIASFTLGLKTFVRGIRTHGMDPT